MHQTLGPVAALGSGDYGVLRQPLRSLRQPLPPEELARLDVALREHNKVASEWGKLLSECHSDESAEHAEMRHLPRE